MTWLAFKRIVGNGLDNVFRDIAVSGLSCGPGGYVIGASAPIAEVQRSMNVRVEARRAIRDLELFLARQAPEHDG
ncbi:hypothetical protein QI633_17770 [Nocardioides sp. QY071]|uniref:hypothetical protein n=1 Tax=Nocardioides sp. QY071 TaxID=3044187 RepID=UPI00249BDE85|nr:hypothetical protein [Nocardioides sp. QY071]WGY00382.1 hypothetical protein QI633_17770 [Nocardioides sp. QY071]